MLKSVLSILAQALHDEGHLDLQETFIDGSFAPAKKGGARVGKTKRGNGSKIMAIADRHGRPIAVHVESAAPHDVTLVNAHSQRGSWKRNLNASLATVATNLTGSMRRWRSTASC